MGLIVYAPALNGEPIWDDEYLVGQNPFYKSPVFVFEVFRHYLFLDSFSIYYRPVQNLSYILDYWIWGGNPFGYHLTNVLLHAVSGFMLYCVLRKLLERMLDVAANTKASIGDSTAFLIALIWTVHPVHSAAVAYIAGRADSLASLFALSAWLLVERAPGARNRWMRLALLAFAALAILLALCSKEIALIWLVLYLLHIFGFDNSPRRRAKFALLASVVCVCALYYLLRCLPGYRAPMEDGPAAPLAARVLLMLRAVGDYTSLIFYPAQLLMDRTLASPAMYGNLASWHSSLRHEYLSIIGSAALVCGATVCRKNAPGQRLRSFGALWFAVAFLPISNLLPLNAQVAEHWIYVASIGYLAFLAGCLLMLSPRGHFIGIGLAVIALFVLGARTALRASDWRGPEKFYTATIEAGGGTPRIMVNLAAVYAKRGEHAKEENILRRTLAVFPGYMPARIGLGICLVNQNRSDEAERFLDYAEPVAEEVSKRFPRTWSAALNLAGVRAKAGRNDEALAIVATTRVRFPEIWELVKYEADLLQFTRGAAAAIPLADSYAAAHWWHEDAWMNLGQLRVAAGEADAGIAAMRAAGRLDICNPEPFANIARIEMSRNCLKAAVKAQRVAIKRDPHQPSRYLMLADMLEKLGRHDEARKAIESAEELRASVTPRGS